MAAVEMNAYETLSPATTEETIRLAGISKYFAAIPALRDINVDFKPGEVHAILGENGAGKSTLMNIIAGTLQPTEGEIIFEGQKVPQMSPDMAASLGIAICFQHPAILNDLSILENLSVALPASVLRNRSTRDLAQQTLRSVCLDLPLNMRSGHMTVAQKHLLEIGKAIAVNPKLLILDEPTASLDQEATEMLFGLIRTAAKNGTAVIYITHRLAEIRQIADRVTVMRDGRIRGAARVSEITDGELVNMIVGRTLEAAFPPKSEAGDLSPVFKVEELSGDGFSNVSFSVARGQILGVAGVSGNGQSELMRALAGLHQTRGAAILHGRQLGQKELLDEAAFMPSDRHLEGVANGLTVRENATFSALEKFATGGILSKTAEHQKVRSIFGDLAVKTPGLEASIQALSGGNQQKVVMARALLSEPGIVIADEPTQGVDVGARFEIYRILRSVSKAGTPVIVNSSDAVELEGICDKVIVMSRGQVVETLVGEEITEERIVAAAVRSEAHDIGHESSGSPQSMSRLRHFMESDIAPVVPLALVTILLGLFVNSQNDNFLSAYNISNILLLATALGFIAMGQTIALLMGGIDLSVGPLAGFLVVIASFFVNEDMSAGVMASGFLLMAVGAFVTGAINGILIRFANFTPIAATLAMYIAIQGLSFLLRENPDGYINSTVTDWVNWQIGPFPVAFLVLVGVTLLGEYALRRSRAGRRLRAVGSNEDSARRVGIRVDLTYVGGYILCSMLTCLGAVMLMTQIGVGDPRQGVAYTLSSITAVVLGGTSLAGGRGTFVGTIMGAVLLTEVLSAVTFLSLTQTYQYLFQGALIVIAALIYSAARRRSA